MRPASLRVRTRASGAISCRSQKSMRTATPSSISCSPTRRRRRAHAPSHATGRLPALVISYGTADTPPERILAKVAAGSPGARQVRAVPGAYMRAETHFWRVGVQESNVNAHMAEGSANDANPIHRVLLRSLAPRVRCHAAVVTPRAARNANRERATTGMNPRVGSSMQRLSSCARQLLLRSDACRVHSLRSMLEERETRGVRLDSASCSWNVCMSPDVGGPRQCRGRNDRASLIRSQRAASGAITTPAGRSEQPYSHILMPPSASLIRKTGTSRPTRSRFAQLERHELVRDATHRALPRPPGRLPTARDG
ncbi:hypothetical protein EVG20_g11423 [Dentipellis fragilis]|uniref:Uncharacterized protein n=1 Tax=Dentipellis fragilis TaxID=205917 RepID=A0A4Y9XLL9_9AGAM|nr:hypothetical protein EVG20_g11423 [Dentipellis fragilis]